MGKQGCYYKAKDNKAKLEFPDHSANIGSLACSPGGIRHSASHVQVGVGRVQLRAAHSPARGPD